MLGAGSAADERGQLFGSRMSGGRGPKMPRPTLDATDMEEVLTGVLTLGRLEAQAIGVSSRLVFREALMGMVRVGEICKKNFVRRA